MTETELEMWLKESSLQINKRTQVDTYFQFILTSGIILFLIGYFPLTLFMPLLLVGIPIYKHTFDQLAYMRLKLTDFRNDWLAQPTVKVKLAFRKIELELEQALKINRRLGRRLFVYLLLVILVLIVL